jgi:hypothetical protein
VVKIPNYDKECLKILKNISIVVSVNKKLNILGIFDAELQSNKNKLSTNISKKLNLFMVKQTKWNEVLNSLTSDENIEVE